MHWNAEGSRSRGGVEVSKKPEIRFGVRSRELDYPVDGLLECRGETFTVMLGPTKKLVVIFNCHAGCWAGRI